MNTSAVYEKLMLEYYYNKIKDLRNQWDNSSEESFLGVDSLIDIGGKDHRQYEYIMNGCRGIIFKMLAHIVKRLIEEYKIPVKYYDLRSAKVDSYYIGNSKYYIDYTDNPNENNILAFSRTDKNTDILFVFKEFGIGNYIPYKTLEGLKKAAHLKKCLYISFVKQDAFSEILNHNNDVNDPTRGTNILSYRQFIESFFGLEEYTRFEEYANRFSKMVKNYNGFTLVRNLNPNAIHYFKKIVNNDLLNVSADEIGASVGLDIDQRDIIEKHFKKHKNYQLLLGNSDFAQSFITAEWLYSSLYENARNIDFTAIAMGYYKAIEQLLFAYIKNLTNKEIDKTRYIYTGTKNKYANNIGLAPITKTMMDDKEITKDLTLGSLTRFFGEYDTKQNRYKRRNSDLLVNGITDTTHNFIIDTFNGVTGLRNGYFHKDNLTDLDRVKVKDIRNLALLVFYLLLGCYYFSESDKANLGWIKPDEYDDYHRLCEYINKKSFEKQFLILSVFYINDHKEPSEYWFAHQDDNIEYDNYGKQIFSGVFFSKYNQVLRFDRDHLPNEILEGKLIISKDAPQYKISEEKKLIFLDGKFMGYHKDNSDAT